MLLALSLLSFGLIACVDETDGGDASHDGEGEMGMKMYFIIGDVRLEAALETNSATAALTQRLKTAPLTIDMSDYGGWEKVGELGFSLPTSNKQITAKPCEFVLYQGNKLVIFYGENSWSYTRLGKIDGVTPAKLKDVLGDGDVSVTLSLPSTAD